jgi:hypothetical protein
MHIKLLLDTLRRREGNNNIEFIQIVCVCVCVKM